MAVTLKNAVARPTVPLEVAAIEQIEGTSLWWLGGAGFLINCRGTIIAIDPSVSHQPGAPTISEIGLPFLVSHPIDAAAIPRLDYVLYTHSDADHLAPVTAGVLLSTGASFVGPGPVVASLREMAPGERYSVRREI